MTTAEEQCLQTGMEDVLSPEALISDFKRIVSARAEATHLSTLSEGQESTFDELLLDDKRNLKPEYQRAEDQQAAMIGYLTISAIAARERAAKANTRAKTLEEGLTMALMWLGRQTKVEITATTPGTQPIHKLWANGTEQERLDHATGIIDEPFVSDGNGLCLRQGNGLLSFSRFYKVDVIGPDLEPLIDLRVLKSK